MNRNDMNKNKTNNKGGGRTAARLKSVMFFCAALILAVFMLSSCNLFNKRIPKPELPSAGGSSDTTPVLRSTDVLDKILNGVRLAFMPDGWGFNIDAKAEFTINSGGKEDVYGLTVNMSFDLDPGTNTADNVYIVELKKDGEDALSLYYKDSLDETPYLYVSAGGEKHAVKFFSVKKLAKMTVSGEPNGGDAWSVESVLGLLPLGEYSDFANVLVKNFILNGEKSIFKSPYISDDGLKAGLKIDVENLKQLLGIAADLVGGIEGVAGAFDDIMEMANIDLTFSSLKDAVAAIPDMDISADATFDADGALLTFETSVVFLEDSGIRIDGADGKEIVGIEIPNGSRYSFALTKLNVTAGAPLFTGIPQYVDTSTYAKHNLINFEIRGVARVEALREILPNGEKVYAAGQSMAYEVEINADIDPFAFIDGIDRYNAEEVLKKLGKLNIYVYSLSDSMSKSTIAEIAYDPENSGDDCLYLGLKLQGVAVNAGVMPMKFDLSDLLELYVFGENAGAGAAVAAGAAASESGGLGIDLSVLTDITGILKTLGLEIETGGDYADFGIALYPRRMKEVAGVADMFLGYGGERLFIGFDSFVYGSVAEDYDAVSQIKTAYAFPYSLAEGDGVLKEYKYGQAFQGGYSTINMNVRYIKGGAVDTSPTKTDLKVMGVRGFDPFTPGRQTVTLFLAVRMKANVLTATAANAVYSTLTDAGIPFGLLKYVYEIEVSEPEDGLTYALESDGVFTGERVIGKPVTITGGESGKVKSNATVASFALFKKEGGAASDAIDANGYAVTAGKFFIEITTSDGAVFSQHVYINEEIFPNLDEVLYEGRPVSDLDMTVKYYDESLQAVVERTVSARQSSSVSLGYVDIMGEFIRGSGKSPNTGSESGSEIKYEYQVGGNGGLVGITRTFSGLAVKFDNPTLKFLTATKSSTAYEDGRIVWMGDLLRADGNGNTYVAQTQYVGTGIVWAGGGYMVYDPLGNVVADNVIITVKKGGEDVTGQYYDAATGKIKMRTGADGGVIAHGSQAVTGLTVELTAMYGDLKSENTAVWTISNLYPKFKYSLSYKTVKRGAALPSGAFQINAYNSVTNNESGSYQTKYDYDAQKYYVTIGKTKYWLDVTVYEKGTENAIPNAECFNSSGGVILPIGNYDMTIKTVIDGYEVVCEYAGSADLRVNGEQEYKAASGARINRTTSITYANPLTGIVTTGTFDMNANGYYFADAKYGVRLEAIKVFDAAANVEIADALDKNGNVVLTAGSYKLIVTVEMEGKTIILNGILKVE
ncbi:MAG: hypothetical protein LBP79_06245 [Clostridiales bacterium]|jgi:hypothetical protein|nr:hypothetical protein [Clostridiales bacterium]